MPTKRWRHPGQWIGFKSLSRSRLPRTNGPCSKTLNGLELFRSGDLFLTAGLVGASGPANTPPTLHCELQATVETITGVGRPITSGFARSYPVPHAARRMARRRSPYWPLYELVCPRNRFQPYLCHPYGSRSRSGHVDRSAHRLEPQVSPVDKLVPPCRTNPCVPCEAGSIT